MSDPAAEAAKVAKAVNMEGQAEMEVEAKVEVEVPSGRFQGVLVQMSMKYRPTVSRPFAAFVITFMAVERSRRVISGMRTTPVFWIAPPEPSPLGLLLLLDSYSKKVGL